MPRVAMINENSPICGNDSPDWSAMCSGWPPMSIPTTPNTNLPTITISESITMGSQNSPSTCGLTIMPTEMKKIAPNRSFTGAVIFSMRSASLVPARMEPIKNAPSAAEKPA